MTSTPKALAAIDVFDLVRTKGVVEGHLAFDAAHRLRVSLRDGDGSIGYQLQGLVDRLGRPAVRLALHGALPLACDRCAQQMLLPVEHTAEFFLVNEESELAALPVLADDEAEPLLGSARFDVAALVEDETILCIPVSPRHDVCPVPADADGAEPARRHNPFTALPSLLRNKRS